VIQIKPGDEVAVLGAHKCWTLLRSVEVGRLAVSIADRPEILPINFISDHGTIVFRTSEGTKLAAALTARHVAFEVDGYDPDAGEAWSVVVKGDAEEIKEIPEVLEAMTFPLFPWPAGPKNRYIRIVPVDVSGRRFRVLDSATWRTTMTDSQRAPSE
jgi:nitroimidazol reductase NimA-like FMN-containing flavoprotein (pyridoxamine 5'-phosphate oxidase superfamily)